MKKILTFVFAIMIYGSLLAQDFHFSQYYAYPLSLNPALTGFFNGDFRIAGTYRNQWKSITPNSFETIAASFDFNIPVIDKSFAGVGLQFFSDKAGDLNFGTTYFALAGSYNLALNPSGNQFLSFGAQVGYSQRSLDPTKMTTETQWQASGGDISKIVPGVNTGEPNALNDSYSFLDISTGLLWSYTPSKSFSSYAGFALSHINQPNQSFFTGGNDKLYMKIALHGGGDYSLSDNMALVPAILFLKQGPAMETNIGSFLRFSLSSNPNSTGPQFYVGPWFRIVGDEAKAIGSDAVIAAIRIDYMNFSGGVSYDINISGLNVATGAKGGPEISLVYIGNISKRIGKKAVTCPRF